MFSSRLAFFAVIGTLVGTTLATFQITSPSPNAWWVADSQNIIAWSCNDNPPSATNGKYTLLINNTNPTVYPGPGALLTNLPNADCSELIGAAQVAALPVATGYTVMLADVGDERKVYAVSQQFEIKAQGSAYASTTIAAQGGTASGSATGSGSSSTGSAKKSNGAFANFEVSTAGVLAAIGVAIGML